MTSTRAIALLATLLGSPAACCIATVSEESGSASGTTTGRRASTSGGTGASSGGSCSALDPSPLAFPIAQVGDCIFDPDVGSDGGPRLLAVSVLISAQPLMQSTFACDTNGPAVFLNYNLPEFFGPALVPGTYEIPGSLDGGWLVVNYVSARTTDMSAASGSVTFTSVSQSEVAGSFGVVFAADGGTPISLSGTFCAPYFGNLNLPP